MTNKVAAILISCFLALTTGFTLNWDNGNEQSVKSIFQSNYKLRKICANNKIIYQDTWEFWCEKYKNPDLEEIPLQFCHNKSTSSLQSPSSNKVKLVDDGSKSTNRKDCFPSKSPVCASDGHTYEHQLAIRCINIYKATNLQIVHVGQCQSEVSNIHFRHKRDIESPSMKMMRVRRKRFEDLRSKRFKKRKQPKKKKPQKISMKENLDRKTNKITKKHNRGIKKVITQANKMINKRMNVYENAFRKMSDYSKIGCKNDEEVEERLMADEKIDKRAISTRQNGGRKKLKRPESGDKRIDKKRDRFGRKGKPKKPKRPAKYGKNKRTKKPVKFGRTKRTRKPRRKPGNNKRTKKPKNLEELEPEEESEEPDESGNEASSENKLAKNIHKIISKSKESIKKLTDYLDEIEPETSLMDRKKNALLSYIHRVDIQMDRLLLFTMKQNQMKIQSFRNCLPKAATKEIDNNKREIVTSVNQFINYQKLLNAFKHDVESNFL